MISSRGVSIYLLKKFEREYMSKLIAIYNEVKKALGSASNKEGNNKIRS